MFLDSVKGKISKASYSTMQKAKDMSELTKLNMAVSESENRIREIYEEIGQIIYKSYQEEPIGEVEKQITELNELERAIEACKLQIRAINAEYSCPKCGGKIKQEMVYCSNCGLRLPDKVNIEEADNKKQFCSECGEILESGALYCAKCGKQVE